MHSKNVVTPKNLPDGPWKILLHEALKIIDDLEVRGGIAKPFWTFGGGTVEWHPKLSHFEENLHPNLSHPNRLSCLIFEQGWARSDQRGNFEQITQTCPSRQGLHPTS
jgi:hypothetical protein